MKAIEAKPLIESLANGIDPETGEILPSDSAFNSPAIIRALLVATQALEQMEKREQREKSQPGNAGKPWTTEEDEMLLAGFDGGNNIRDLAAKHGRTAGSITSRLMRLGRLTVPTDTSRQPAS